MAVLSGFFNSVSDDRKYDAESFNNFLEGVIAEGVFSTIGGYLIVSPSAGMQIQIASGKAWFLKSWLYNTAVAYLTLDASEPLLDRIDIIALDFDKSTGVRENDIVIVKGTPAASPVAPTLTDTSTHLQVPLAHIYVNAGASTIGAGDITNKVGTVDCPFVVGLLDQLEITDLLAQWQSEFDAWMQYIEDLLEDMDTGDIFAYLDDIANRPVKGRNLLVNGDMFVAQRNTSPVTGYSSSSASGEFPLADRWKLNLSGAGTWTLSLEDISTEFGPDRIAYKILCTTPKASLGHTDIFTFSQTLEGSVFAELGKGLGAAEARPMVLSWKAKSKQAANFIVEIIDEQNGWSISHQYSFLAADLWTDFEWVIPAETQQALNLNALAGLTINFWLVASDTYTGGGSLQDTWGATTTDERAYGQYNLAASVNNYMMFTDIQLEIGELKTPYERLGWTDSVERCKRYFHSVGTLYAIVGICETAGKVRCYQRAFRTRMRYPPTKSMTSGTVYIAGTGYAATGISNTGGGRDEGDAVEYDISTAASLTVGNMYLVKISGLMFDSEF